MNSSSDPNEESIPVSSDVRPVELAKAEKVFLEGRHSRWRELNFTWGVMMEFIRGFRKLHFIGPCVTVFGSARFKDNHHYYQLARQIGERISKLGFTVMTGGGPGIMEAANRGAKDAGGLSVGCNIILEKEQKPNPFLDRYVLFRHFFVRKVLLFKYSVAFVVMPGGVGTMDEMFEALTLIQTKKISGFPVILVGKEYWKNLFELVQDMAGEGTIAPHDLDLFKMTDDPDEVVLWLTQNTTAPKKKAAIRRYWFFGE